jgi:hypothetical protein
VRPASRRPARAEEDDELPDDEDRPRRPARRRRPEPEDEEEEDRPRRRRPPGRPGRWARCPNCGARDASRVHYTLWGGLIGPLIINTVRCRDCGTQYNGVHGDYNTGRIAIFVGVSLAIGVVLILIGVLSSVLVGPPRHR